MHDCIDLGIYLQTNLYVRCGGYELCYVGTQNFMSDPCITTRKFGGSKWPQLDNYNSCLLAWTASYFIVYYSQSPSLVSRIAANISHVVDLRQFNSKAVLCAFLSQIHRQ